MAPKKPPVSAPSPPRINWGYGQGGGAPVGLPGRAEPWRQFPHCAGAAVGLCAAAPSSLSGLACGRNPREGGAYEDVGGRSPRCGRGRRPGYKSGCFAQLPASRRRRRGLRGPRWRLRRRWRWSSRPRSRVRAAPHPGECFPPPGSPVVPPDARSRRSVSPAGPASRRPLCARPAESAPRAPGPPRSQPCRRGPDGRWCRRNPPNSRASTVRSR